MKFPAIMLISLGVFTYWHTAISRSLMEWKIDNISLTPDSDPAHRLPDNSAPNKLTVTVSNSGLGVHLDLSSDVRLTSVRDSFISNSKFVAIGQAAVPYEVAIFDLSSKRLIDWFDCYGPRRVSDNWIAYVEWYPNHGMGTAKEVLLLYDLAKTPAENRLPSAERLPIPAPIATGASQVGIPVFPESNVQQRSYVNVVQGPGGRHRAARRGVRIAPQRTARLRCRPRTGFFASSRLPRRRWSVAWTGAS